MSPPSKKETYLAFPYSASCGAFNLLHGICTATCKACIQSFLSSMLTLFLPPHQPRRPLKEQAIFTSQIELKATIFCPIVTEYILKAEGRSKWTNVSETTVREIALPDSAKERTRRRGTKAPWCCQSAPHILICVHYSAGGYV